MLDIIALSIGVMIVAAFVAAFIACPIDRFGTIDETINEDVFSDFID